MEEKKEDHKEASPTADRPSTDWAALMSADYAGGEDAEPSNPPREEPTEETRPPEEPPTGDASEAPAAREPCGETEDRSSKPVADQAPNPATPSRSRRLASRGMRAHVALGVVAVALGALSVASSSASLLGLGFATPLASALSYASSLSALLPAALCLAGVPALSLAVAAGGVSDGVTRAACHVAWVIDCIAAAASLCALALSAMGSAAPTVAACGALAVATTYLAVNDELAARAANRRAAS